MHNLSTVIGFEVARTIKKKSFWIAAISFPLMFVAIFGIVFLANKTTDDATNKLKDQSFSIAVTDESKLIKPEMLTAVKATTVTVADKQSAIDRVKNGQLDAYYYYPQDLATHKVEIYGKDVGLFDNGRYSSVANVLLSSSVESNIDPTLLHVVKGEVEASTTTYRDGKEYNSLKQMILPGIFLLLLYFLITFFGNQMLTSTIEEKENRVIEMILTTIEARTLIVGKIISLIILAIVQGLLVVLPALIIYLLFHDKLALPSFDLSNLPVDPFRIGLGFVIFACSFLLFTGILVLAGAASPTAKEASSFFGVVMISMFGPMYAASLFVSMPDSPLVKFLSLFPLTAPIPLLLRNALGNLGIGEALLGVAILFATASVIVVVAVRVFRYGALEYSRKLSLREIVGRK